MFVQFCVFFWLASMRVVVATALSLSSQKPHVALLQPSFFITFLFMLSDPAVWVARFCHMSLNLLHVYRWNRCVFDGHTQLVRTVAIVICPPASRSLSPRAEMWRWLVLFFLSFFLFTCASQCAITPCVPYGVLNGFKKDVHHWCGLQIIFSSPMSKVHS